MVRPPSQGSCLSLYPFCVRHPEGLHSHCTPSWMVCPPSEDSWLPLPFLDGDGGQAFSRVLTPFVSDLCPFLHGVSAFPRILTPIVRLLGWCVRLPEDLDSDCIPSWMVCPPSRGSWLPLYPFWDTVSGFPNVLTLLLPLLGWCKGLDSLCTPSVSAILRAFTPIVPLLGWCVLLQKTLDSHYPSWMVMVGKPFKGLDSFCLPLCPFLDGVSAFPRVLTPIVRLLGWCVRLPEDLDSDCTPSWMVCPPSQGSWLPLYAFLDGVSAFRRVLTRTVPLLGWFVRLPKSWPRL